jgi:hypothetical protein
MPATRASANRSIAAIAATATGHYNLRSNRPAAGHFADMDDEPEHTAADYAAAAALVSMRSSASVPASAPAMMSQRRSARIANRA